jgi:6-phosphogluconolactonase
MRTWIRTSSLALFPLLTLAVGCSQAASTEESENKGSTSEALSRNAHHGALFTITNATKNELVAFDRRHDGTLALAGKFATGGAGSGDGLGSQGALARAGEYLLVVDAGSNEITTFALRHGVPVVASRVSSGGTRPVSLTVHDRIVYVLNAGATANVTGFWLKDDGSLAPISDSTQSLSAAAAGGAQIAFDPDGDTLIVTEKATSAIDAYSVDWRGRAHGPVVHPSSGTTPFGFGFTPRGELVVSEAFAGAANKAAVSAYALYGGIDVAPISKSVPDGETAACWIQIDEAGRYAFTANAGSGNVSSYRIERDGRIVLKNAVAGDIGSGSHPVDMAMSDGGEYLYVLANGNGTVASFEVHGGDLVRVGTVSGVPATAAGLAAW